MHSVELEKTLLTKHYKKIDKSTNHKHTIIHAIKQDIHIYIAYSRPNGWTDWPDFFVDTRGWPMA